MADARPLDAERFRRLERVACAMFDMLCFIRKDGPEPGADVERKVRELLDVQGSLGHLPLPRTAEAVGRLVERVPMRSEDP